MTKYIDIHTHNPREDVLSPTMAGIHPWQAEEGAKLPDFSNCDIVGETGLDYACKVDRDRQKELFLGHLAKAQQLGKPVVLHVVRALNDTLSILSEFKGLKGVVFHGFIGSKEQAAECIKRGYYLSFGERSLRSPKTREVIAKMPQNLLFCETDDNTSVAIEEIYRSVAEIRGTTPEELLKTIEDNYKNLFT